MYKIYVKPTKKAKEKASYPKQFNLLKITKKRGRLIDHNRGIEIDLFNNLASIDTFLLQSVETVINNNKELFNNPELFEAYIDLDGFQTRLHSKKDYLTMFFDLEARGLI